MKPPEKEIEAQIQSRNLVSFLVARQHLTKFKTAQVQNDFSVIHLKYHLAAL